MGLIIGADISELKGVCISYLAVDASRVSMTLEASFRQAFPDFEGRFSALDHHLAHALGAKVCSGFNEALVVVADGAGDQRLWGSQSETIYHVSSDTFYLLDERVQSPPLTEDRAAPNSPPSPSFRSHSAHRGRCRYPPSSKTAWTREHCDNRNL